MCLRSAFCIPTSCCTQGVGDLSSPRPIHCCFTIRAQGVGDLYTDPQLHTLDGEGYGEGNLGLRGMALFFRTHECNALCRRLGLNPFER